MRGDPHAASGEVLPTMEGQGPLLELSEVRFEGIRRRGSRVRHLDGLELLESVSDEVPIRCKVFRGQFSRVPPAPGPRNRPDLALLHDAQILARAAVEDLPSRLHPWHWTRRPRSGDAYNRRGRNRSLHTITDY